MNNTNDVVVIGGGPAGLNGALMLARSRRSVTVVDSGAPRNAPASGIHGLLGREGISPDEFLRLGRAEVIHYGGQIIDGEATDTRREGKDIVVTLADGSEISARRLLIASGLVDVLPDVPGLQQRWGRDVVHCPYCHGWEVRDQAIGVLATGPASPHHAMLFRQLSNDIIYFSNDMQISDDQRVMFSATGIDVIDEPVTEVEIADDRIDGLRLSSGRVVPRRVIAVATRMEARAGFLGELGVPLDAHPAGAGHHLRADAYGKTEVPGVWVAGNATELTAQVGAAAAAGALAGAHINSDLVTEDALEAVAAYGAG